MKLAARIDPDHARRIRVAIVNTLAPERMSVEARHRTHAALRTQKKAPEATATEANHDQTKQTGDLEMLDEKYFSRSEN